jgi:hypothetical protein
MRNMETVYAVRDFDRLGRAARTTRRDVGTLVIKASPTPVLGMTAEVGAGHRLLRREDGDDG